MPTWDPACRRRRRTRPPTRVAPVADLTRRELVLTLMFVALALAVGGERVYAEFEGGHSHETKIRAVHFVRFTPTVAMVAALADLRQRVTLSVHHNGYCEEVGVPGTMREEWLKDLEDPCRLSC